MLRIAFILALIVAPAKADTCHDKAMLEAFLKHELGLRLYGWGLNKDEAMIELWIAPSGMFAVVTTTPEKCSTVGLPHDLHGRLWTPTPPNKAIPEDRTMNKGQGL
jgi:hypothetical protein